MIMIFLMWMVFGMVSAWKTSVGYLSFLSNQILELMEAVGHHFASIQPQEPSQIVQDFIYR